MEHSMIGITINYYPSDDDDAADACTGIDT